MRAAAIAVGFSSLMIISTPGHAQREAGAKDGQAAFNNACRTCHTVEQGDNRQGPSLAGVVGRKSGQVEGYNYSSALADGKITWDEATLNKFIENPEAVAPGNNMKPFGGISDPKQRELIVAYLAAHGGGGGASNAGGQPAEGEKPADEREPAAPAPAQ